MASEILGLFASPELYQQNQDLLRQQQALQYAQLDPYDRVTYGANLAGQRFGGALGSALGGTDPQLRIISARQSVMQGVDPSNPESILRAAQQLADVGDQQGALTLADYARKAGSELALQQQRLREGRAASTPKELQIANATAQLQQRIRELQAAPESPERNAELQIATDTLARLTATTKSANVPKEIEIANARAALQGRIRALEKQPESEERNNELQTARDTLASLPQAGGRAGQVPDAIEIARERAVARGLTPGSQLYNEFIDKELQRLTTKETKEPSANISEVGVAVGTNAPVYIDKNKDEQFIYVRGADGKQVRQPYFGGVDRTTAKVSTSVAMKGETAFAEKLGTLDAKRVDDALATRDNAIAAINSLKELTRLDNQGLISGSFATGRVGATNFLSTLGLVSGADADKLSRSENYQKVAGDIILATLGGRLGAGFSNEDRNFIQRLIPQLENSAQARRQLLDFLVTKNNAIIEETTRLEEYARQNNSLKGYKPTIPIVKQSSGNAASGMTDQQLRDAYNKAKKGGR